MKIAATCQNLKTRKLSGHAGRIKNYLVFDVNDAGEIQELEPITLSAEDVPHNYFHERGGKGAHPLFDVIDVLLVGSAGKGFIVRTGRMDIETLITLETDATAAVTSYLAGALVTEEPHHHHHH